MATITIQRDGVISGGNAMGRFIDLTDVPALVAGAYLKVDGGGTKLEMASGVVYGDLDFSDLLCEKCKRPFEEGEELTLIVVAKGPEKIRTRPVHRFCTEV